LASTRTRCSRAPINRGLPGGKSRAHPDALRLRSIDHPGMIAKLSPRRILSPALLLAVVGCFLLPFATVSCEGERVTPTGIQLVIGDAPENESQAPDGHVGQLGDEVIAATHILAIVAFTATLVAVAAAFVYGSPSRIVFLLSELAFLGFVWVGLQGAMTYADVEYGPGFWLGCLLLIGSMGLHVTAMRHRGLWVAVVVGIPGMIDPLVLAAEAVVAVFVYFMVWRWRRAPSQALRPPSDDQTAGKNGSSIEVSPTRL
jgi:hypothetical protein